MRLKYIACLPGVLLFCDAASAQDPSRHAVELSAVGRQTANEVNYVYGLPSGTIRVVHEQIFGGVLSGYSFALTPHLALEARAGYLFGRQIQVPQNGGEQIMAHAGIRATVPLGRSRFGLRARVAPGIASFSSAIRTNDLTLANPGGFYEIVAIPHYGRITHFSLEEGVGLSTRLSTRTFFNVDVSHEILLEGDRTQVPPGFANLEVEERGSVEDHAVLAVGLSRSFGKAFSPPAQLRAFDDRVSVPSNELVVSYALQPTVHLEMGDLGLDAGVAFTGSHFLRNWLALDSSIVFLPAGDEPNYQDGGHQTQFFAGVKFGIRRDRYGIFGKARPGLISYSGTYNTLYGGTPPSVIADDFGGDLGAVFELYPARRLVLRFDLGETLIRYSAVTVSSNFGTQAVSERSADAPQFLVGVGYRF